MARNPEGLPSSAGLAAGTWPDRQPQNGAATSAYRPKN
jgi:hypothetical protein